MWGRGNIPVASEVTVGYAPLVSSSFVPLDHSVDTYSVDARSGVYPDSVRIHEGYGNERFTGASDTTD